MRSVGAKPCFARNDVSCKQDRLRRAPARRFCYVQGGRASLPAKKWRRQLACGYTNRQAGSLPHWQDHCGQLCRVARASLPVVSYKWQAVTPASTRCRIAAVTGSSMTDKGLQPDLVWLADIIRERIERTMRKVNRWNWWGLPACLALSGMLCSGLNRYLFTVDDSVRFFALSAPVWLIAHVIFVVSFQPLLNDQTERVLANMLRMNFLPSGMYLSDRIIMLEYGCLVGMLYLQFSHKRNPNERLAAITEYHEACGENRIMPFPGLIVYLELLIQLGIFIVFGIGFWSIATGKIEGGQGFNATELVVAQCLFLATYIMTTCGVIRELALLRALEISITTLQIENQS